MRIVEWTVPAFQCANCLRKIRMVVEEIEGVSLKESNPSKHCLTLEGQTPEVLAYTKRRLAEAGYPVTKSG